MINKLIQRFDFRFILALVLILSALLRFYNLDFQSPWLDEIHTLNESNPNLSLFELYDEIQKGERLPPMYFYIIYFLFKIFGYSIFIARAFSALVGVIAVYSIYLLTRELINRKVALFAALFLGINYFMIYYSQEARPYMLYILFTILSFYRMLLFIKTQSLKNAVWFGVMSCLMIHSHLVGFFTLFAQAVIILIYLIYKKNIDKRLFVKRGLIAAGVLIILYIPAIDSLLNIFELKSFWLKLPKADALSVIYNRFFGNSDIILFFNLIFFIGFVIWLMDLQINKNNKKEKYISNKWVSITLILWISLSLLIPLVRTYVSVPMILDRYLISILPAVIIMFSIGLAQIRNKLISSTLAILYSIFSLVNIFFILNYYSTATKAQFREISTYIMEKNTNNDKVVTSLPQYLPYFFQKENKSYELIGANLDNFIGKQIQNKYPVSSFWYFDGHGRKYNPKERTKKFLVKNYITLNSYSGLGAWARHYVVKNDSNSKIEFTSDKIKKDISSNLILAGIGKFVLKANYLKANGWAVIKNVNSQSTSITALLIRENTGYLIETTGRQRNDVTSTLKVDYDVNNSGFEIDTNLDYIPKGNYKFALMLKNENDNIESLFISKKEVQIK